MTEEKNDRRTAQQFKRLKILTDVVYAIVIWRLFALIPRPGQGEFQWHTIDDYFRDNVMTIVMAIVGLVVIIIYWLQNNALFGNLKKTDGRHTTYSIIQIFCLMIFLSAMKIGIDLGEAPETRGFESFAAALLGIPAALGYWHGIKNRRLIADDVSDEEAKELGYRVLAEPITAGITLFFIFTPILWELSWLLYPLVLKLLKMRARK
jgi:uncharacterized membrane protein